MSKKEKGKEENEGEILHHFYHEHPLSLTVAGTKSCYGCQWMISPEETAYTCNDKCGSNLILHEECAEMPREITLSMHPQHILIQMEKREIPQCFLCAKEIFCIGYYCKSSDPCSFGIHVGCAQDMKVLKTCIDHPNHPHQLTLWRRPGQSYSFRCDACGTTEKGNSYMCLDCQYWIHESCTALPRTMDFPRHHHALSLAFHVPPEYVRLDFKCHICFKYLLPRYWVYHCQTCSYVVHIKCVIDNVFKLISNMDVNAAEDKDVITFPADYAIEDMIRSFVTKVREEEEVLQADPNGNYKFHNHNHQLRLISSTPHDQAKEKESVNDDDDDDDEYLQYGNKTKLVCDGCTMPISQKKANKYMSCSECKYFLHLPCSQLPPKLLSHPLHHQNQADHILTLQTSHKLDLTTCYVCWLGTNGLFYKCTNYECSFIADVKCASLPDTIKHSAHPNHHLKLLSQMATSIYMYRPCGGCGYSTGFVACYICNICDFILHSSCCLLPESVTNRTWDKHPLPLIFVPSVDPSNIFYCEVCEIKMDPKRWMYHCHDCDVSIHPDCLTTQSCKYRNIKFGQRYVVDEVHSHPLSYQLLTTKLRCDVCKERKDYGSRGFQCYSDKCDFFMCLYPCGIHRQHLMQAVD